MEQQRLLRSALVAGQRFLVQPGLVRGATPPGAPAARSRSSSSLSSHRRKAGAQPEPAELFAQQEEPVPWAGDQEDDEEDDKDENDDDDDGQDTWAFEQDE